MVVAKDDEDGGINDQKKKYEEIISVLLEAGYFRARISTLSEFDKCVGGLCWAIVNSGVEVDVDILFTENATIGQRIALSEAIVVAMRKMKCPHNLQPHQIQGGIGGADYIVILPVIKWLIQKFFAVREERDLQLRSFSTLQFGRDYTFPHEAEINEITPELYKVLARNKAIRKYRRKTRATEAEETRVHSCLLEYGYNTALMASSNTNGNNKNGGKDANIDNNGMIAIGGGDVSASGIGAALGTQSDGGQLSGFEKKLMQEALKAEKEEAEYLEMQSKEAQELMESMQSLDESSGLVGGALAGSLLGLGGGDISQASAEYLAQLETNALLMEKNIQGGKLGAQAAYKRQRQNLLNQKADIDVEYTKCLSNTNIVLDKLRHIEEETAEAKEYNEQLLSQINKLTDMENGAAQQNDLKTLKSLIILNESLKGQEISFKSSCKVQVAEYKARIAALKEADKPDSDENRKLKDIEDMHSKIMFKYDKLRQMIAEMNLEVSANARIIDDIPTRTELIQYERRFGELYQQVAWKLKETRKYYDMYNTLDTTLGFMQKNVKIVDGIYQGFYQSMKTPEDKFNYLQQVKTITKGVTDSLNNQEIKLSTKSTQCENLKIKYKELVDEQRSYYAAIKDFQTECEKNDWLTAKLEAAKSS